MPLLNISTGTLENGGCAHSTRLPATSYRRRNVAPCLMMPGTCLPAIYNPSPLLNLTTHTPTHPLCQISHPRTPTYSHTATSSAQNPLAPTVDITTPRSRTSTLPHPTPLSHLYIALPASILKLNHISPSAPLYPAKIETNTMQPYKNKCTLRGDGTSTASPSRISLPYLRK